MACALYRGDFLQGINVREPDFDTWLTAERARLRQLAIEAHERYLRLLIEANDVGGAIQAALRLIGLDPLQEWAHRALIRLYVERGQLAMAVAQYNQCEQIMASELGVEPEPETKRLRQELLHARAKATGNADVTAASGPRDAAAEPPPRRHAPGDAPAPLREEWHRRKRAGHSPKARDRWHWRTKGNG
jgi:DNA-binding SARP family transcriptional activator